MALLRIKAESLAAAVTAAALTAGAVIVWGNHRLNHLERMISEKPAAAFAGPDALDRVRGEVKAGIKEFLQESAARSGETRQPRGADSEFVEAPAVTENDHVLGRPDAPVTMLVYTDIECPYCRQFHRTTLPALRARFPDLRIVYRHMPLPFHAPAAVDAAVMAECVARNRGAEGFYAFMDAAFASTNGNGKGLGARTPPALAALLEGAKACVDQRETLPVVEASVRGAERLGVTGTPTIFLMRLGARRALIFRGAAPAELLAPRIEQLKTGKTG